MAEIRFGIERLPIGRRKTVLASTADEPFDTFGERVLPFDVQAAVHDARLARDRTQQGLPIDGFDVQIAAICLRKGARKTSTT